MFRRVTLLLCACVAMPALPATLQWGGSITAASDYLVRGTSRNYNDPVLSTAIHVQSGPGLFASLWASSTRLRYGDPVTAELSATVGFAGSLADSWTWTTSLTHYDTPWSSHSTEYRYDELTVDFSWRERLLLSASWSPNTSRFSPEYGFARRRRATDWEIGYQQELPARLHAYAGVGYYDLSALFGRGYWYGSVALGWTWHRWQADASYVMPDGNARRLSYPGAAGRRAVASLSLSF
jgi:uncharacterized protein (TIGR02001 family)